MTAPVFDNAPVWMALPIGIAFGVVLERAGLGSARTIAAQLSFRDWTVVKVMFTAIVTAALGVFWSEQLGWLDLSRVAIPTTDVGPQIIGALIFGAGFAMSALCPGTACVSAATGRVDGLVTMGGIFAGSILTAEFWPQLGVIAERAPRDGATLSQDLGVSAGLIVFVIVALAILACGFASAVERSMRGQTMWPQGSRTLSRPAVAALSLGVLGAVAKPSGASVATLHEVAREISNEGDHIDPLDLATWIRDRHKNVRVFDVVESLESERGIDRYIIPGATIIALPAVPSISVAPTDTVVLYSAGGAHAAQAWVLLRARGVKNVYVIKDGMAAWEDEVMMPTAPTDTSKADIDRYKRARELKSWFGGTPITDPGSYESAGSSSTTPNSSTKSAPVLPAHGKKIVRRRNTC